MHKILVYCMAENPEFHSLPSFLFGQSMGGAVALKIHLKQPKAWDGAILVAPMCKVFSLLKTQSCYEFFMGFAFDLPFDLKLCVDCRGNGSAKVGHSDTDWYSQCSS